MLRQKPQLHLLISILSAVPGAFLAWVILDPSTGFDDANITMNFAQNIANGAGYVYYVGGEIVEGSSSALWTLINTVAYLFFDDITVALSFLGLIICIASIYIAIQITQLLLQASGQDNSIMAWLTGPAFLLFPSYFAYMVWSLMDIGLFILLVSTMIYSLMRLIRFGMSRVHSLLFIGCAALLSAARPEGIVVAIGLSVFLWTGLRITGRRGAGVAITALIATLLVIAALTVLRLWYFGQPLPNTFYAKVSTSYVSQFIEGLKYTIRYLYDFANLSMLALFFIAIMVLRRSLDVTVFWWATLGCTVGAFAIYSALGGDHFGSFRFFQVLTPLLLPWAVAAIIVVGTGLSHQVGGWRRGMGVMAVAVVVIAAWGQFGQTRGGLDPDFRIAEAGRETGEILNEFEPLPSLGILAAGGISMTYEGEIFDLLGLNWVKMAHSNRAAMRVKNNSGFSQTVFFDNPPDLILPEIRSCALPPMDYQWVMDEVIISEAFQQLYRYDCYKGLTFYIKRDIALPAGHGG